MFLKPRFAVSDTEIASSSAGGIILAAAPRFVPVTVGISNDTLTEITSGVKVGDQIITKTIKSTTGSTAIDRFGGTSLNTSALRALAVAAAVASAVAGAA